jgi:nucleoside-diphosphate-sugar epimerase
MGPRDEDELEELLSEPTPGVHSALAACTGDVMVLGAGGKMGPSLTRMLQRVVNAAGDGRRVIAVSRFTSTAVAESLSTLGVQVIRGDLAESETVRSLPQVPNLIYMAGQKFGTMQAPARTWLMNTAVPSWVADHFRGARIVVFSTGNVYGLTTPASGGSRESDPLSPAGEYAASCVGRERMFEYAAGAWGTNVAILRLNYAVDLRYGVLVDIASRVRRGEPIDVSMGWFNCIWQGDANALALASLRHTGTPATILNLTGPERLRVRDVAQRFAQRFRVALTLSGQEAGDALLSNTDKMQSLVGAPRVSAAELEAMVASWLERGGANLGLATHFEERGGAF